MAALPTVNRNSSHCFFSHSRKTSAALAVLMPAMSPAATRDYSDAAHEDML
jgi:hypothetical protein